VRFAAPPLRQLRWAKPAPPLKTEVIQDGTEGRSCTQSSSRLILGGSSASPPGEDCLFLDVTVPAKAIKTPSAKLPVMGKSRLESPVALTLREYIAWFYGGAYSVGSKEQR
jgi:carboxylesterase type B